MSTTSSPIAEAGVKITGNVHGGQQPVVGAHVYLMAASTTGYGGPGLAASSSNASVSLLVPSSTGQSDSIGGYVLTGADGSFNIYGDYTCTAGTQVYIYVQGGNPGAGVNSAASFMAALGQCPSSGSLAASDPFVFVNEISTVTTAYAIAGFATDALHVGSSGTALAQTGIANAFANVVNMENIATGTVQSTTPVGNGTVPAATIDTLANILASCVNSTGPTSTSCTQLFSNAKSGGSTGTTPTETATAAINIAHNPGANVAALYALPAPAAAFSPSLTTQPNDFTIGINYTGGGLAGAGVNGAYSVAIDAHGDAWFTNIDNSSVSKLSANGEPQSPSTGFIGGVQGVPTGIAIDGSENAWVSDAGSNNLTEYNTVGAPLSPAGGYTGGGLYASQAISIYDSSAIWVANFNDASGGNGSLSKFNFSGVAQSPATGFQTGGINRPVSVKVDPNGNVWVANQGPLGSTGSVSKINADGTAAVVAGITAGGINDPFSVVLDSGQNAWIANFNGNSLTKLTNAGAALSPSTGFTGGGLNRPYDLAVDGASRIWAVNYGTSPQGPSVSLFDNSGNPLSPSTGLAGTFLNGPQAIAVDGSGNVWIGDTNSSYVTQLIGVAVPVITPLATAISQNKMGTRP